MTKLTTILALLSSSLLATTAFADAPAEAGAPRPVTAPNNALEFSVGTFFARGTGDLGGGLPAVSSVAGPGIGLDAFLGWRATPNLAIGGYATLTGFGDRDTASNGAVTIALGVKADWHFLPTAQLDPWISLGTGVKLMGIEDGDRDRALTGLELAKLQVGVDYRTSHDFAISPFLGASAARFNHQYDEQMSNDAMAIDNKAVNWTFSLGVLGRFDTL